MVKILLVIELGEKLSAFVRCQQEIWVLFFLYFSTIFTQNFMPIADLTGHQAFQLKKSYSELLEW